MGRQWLAIVVCTDLLAAALAGHATVSSSSPVTVYSAPPEMTNVLGEPTIGVDWRTGSVLYESGYRTYRVRLNPASGRSSWVDVTSSLAQDTNGDPVLWVDPRTGRAIESQEFFTCSFSLLSDNDGQTWSPDQGCGLGTFADHQTVGGGPYATTTPAARGVYGDAIYYCAQDGGFTGGTAYCARSDDGGLTFGPGVPIYNEPGVDSGPSGVSCVPLHGKVRVSRNGSVYVPNNDCRGRVGVTVSRDNGMTWTLHTVPGSSTQDESDPAIAPAGGGTVYMAWQQGPDNDRGSSLDVALSTDYGATWFNRTDLSSRLGVRNIQFPTVVAGDNDRAAVAFLGSTTPGDDQRGATDPNAKVRNVFPGVWHLYVAVTLDSGKHWTTIDATPDDPVQRGCISMTALATGCRNLLDYNDITLDVTGHVLVAFTDGCIRECVTHELPANAVYSQYPDYRARHGNIVRLDVDPLLRPPGLTRTRELGGGGGI